MPSHDQSRLTLSRILSALFPHVRRHTRTGPTPRRDSRLRRPVLEPLEDRAMLSLSGVLLVDADATGGNTGASWTDAFVDLQDALERADVLNADGSVYNDIDQIWIAEGTYRPSAELEPGDPRSASFSLVDRVTLYGGLAGTEANLAERDLAGHTTRLSGDLGVVGDKDDNAYTVVYCGEGVTAGVDGVTVTGGSAYASEVEDHEERELGGGVFNAGGLSIAQCAIEGNRAERGGGVNNWGIMNIERSIIQNNRSIYGAGIRNDGDGCTLTVTNCVIVDNDGDGILHRCDADDATLLVTNTTISANYDGSGIDCPYASSYGGTSVTLNNCIVAGNATDLVDSYRSEPFTIFGSHNLIGNGSQQDGLIDGIDGNIVGTRDDPADPMLSDWTQFADGSWGFVVLEGSPVEDAGSNALAVDADGDPLVVDFHGNPRIQGDSVNIGAFELTTPGTPGRTYTVTSLSNAVDPGDGLLTFVEAIEASQRNQPVGDAPAGSFSERDVIQFAPGLEGTLSVGGSPFQIEGDVLIEGPGAESLIVHAGGQSGAFHVRLGAHAEFNGLAFTGGNGDQGGAISSYGYLTVRDCAFHDNQASSDGGAIASCSGSLSVRNCDFTDNVAGDDGGAIYTIPEGFVFTSTFRGNSAHDGAAIYTHSAISISNTLICENEGSRGVIFTCDWRSSVNITSTTIANNRAYVVYCFMRYANIVVTNSIFWQNEGPFHATAMFQERTTSLFNIDPLFVDMEGGDYRLSPQSPAINIGDGSYVDGTRDSEGYSLLETDVAGNARIHDGRVDVGAYEFTDAWPVNREQPSLHVTTASDTVDVSDGLCSLREAILYAANDLSSVVTFDESLNGATIALEHEDLLLDKSVRIDASSLESITVDAHGDSGVFWFFGGEGRRAGIRKLTVTGGDEGVGGGVYITGDFEIQECIFSGNTARAGGAIYRRNGELLVSDTTFVENTATGGYSNGGGGAIYSASNLSIPVVSNCVFRDNTTDGVGGAVFVEGNIRIVDSLFSGNEASYGGAIGRGQGWTSTTCSVLTNCLIVENTAGRGGAIYSSGKGLTLTNCTLARNQATYWGGIGGGGHLTINNCVLWNQNGEIAPRESVDCTNSLIGINPGFVDPDAGDYRLAPTSPAIDLGDTSLVDGSRIEEGYSLTETDMGGSPRVFGGAVDLGAYEYCGELPPGRDVPTAVVTGKADILDAYDGVISIREAILQASAGGTHVVTFDESLSGETIALDGCPIVILDDSLTIDAAAAELVTIDAGGRHRGFDVFGTEDGHVELSHLAVVNGFASNGSPYVWHGRYDGGAVFTLTDLTLSHCTFSGNTAQYGGAVSAPQSDLTIVDCMFSKNSAIEGGAVKHSTWNDDRPLYECNLTIIGSTFSENTAERIGAVYALSEHVEIANSLFSGNTADSEGAVYCSAFTVSLANSVFVGNSTTTGSVLGVRSPGLYGFEEPNDLAVVNCTVAGNEVLEDGYAAAFSSMFDDLTFANNIVAANCVADESHGELELSRPTDPGASFIGSHNLIGDGSGQTALRNGTNGNLVGTAEAPIDPGFIRNPSDGGDGWRDDPETPEIDESANNDYGDLRLRTDSVAFDAGDNGLLPADVFDLDSDGNTDEPLPIDIDRHLRIWGGTVDMGAYEWCPELPPDNRLYVDADATGENTGMSWSDAFTTLAAALDYAATILSGGTKADSGHLTDTVHEIWIAEGTYTPSAERDPGDPRSAAYELVDGVTLFGGFAATEGAIGERDPDTGANETVLSGDIGVAGDVADNAYSVVVCPVDVTAGLDGVTITGGYAVDPTTTIYRENSYGGGIYNEGDLTVSNTRLVGNAAKYGGAAHNHLASLEFTNVAVAGNTAQRHGGAICNSGTLTLTNATVAGNEAASNGGAIYSYGTAPDVLLQNTILAGNTADVCPTTYIAAGALSGRNNLLDDGTDQAKLVDGTDENLVGTAASSIDPRFVRNPSGGGDGWGDDPATAGVDESANDDYGDLRLQSESPAVDGGDSSALPVDSHDFDGDDDLVEPLPFDLAGALRIEGDSVDIGAYEFAPAVTLPGDLNGDGTVSGADLDIVRAYWGQTVAAGSLLEGDPSGDGTVSGADLDIVRANWGRVAAASVADETASGDEGKATARQRVVDAAFADIHAAAEAVWREAVETLGRGKRNRVGPLLTLNAYHDFRGGINPLYKCGHVYSGDFSVFTRVD